MDVTERLLEISENAVKLAIRKDVSEALATAFLWDTSLTRFANSEIHQNVSAVNGGVLIKLALGKKLASIRVNSLDDEVVGRTVERATEIAKSSPPNEHFKGFPKPERWVPVSGAFDEDTATCSPESRSGIVSEIIQAAHSKSPEVKAVAGSLSTGFMAFAVSNSWGLRADSKLSLASVNTTVISEGHGSFGYGYSEDSSRVLSDLDHVLVADEASQKSVRSLAPLRLDPGVYEVVLSPVAVSTFVLYLAMIGFTATSYQDGVSFVNYNLNEQVFDEKLSIVDDARDERTLLSVPIDGEGVPKRRVQLVDGGVVGEQSICYDSLTASKEGKKSTGHSLPPVTPRYPSSRPIPINIVVSPGEASMEDMIREVEHGVFVTRFHYTRAVNPTQLVLTGLTRDGTFLIEKGEIGKPVRNLRYTDSLLSALKDIVAVGKNLKRTSTSTIPAMSLRRLRFTGVTEH